MVLFNHTASQMLLTFLCPYRNAMAFCAGCAAKAIRWPGQGDVARAMESLRGTFYVGFGTCSYCDRRTVVIEGALLMSTE